jgi:predicted double-glycine peptidase
VQFYNPSNNQALQNELAELSQELTELRVLVDSAATGYKSTFSNADIDASGIYIAAHNLGTIATSVSVFDETGEQIFPGEITVIDANVIAIDLSAYTPINGNYKVLIYG